MNPFPKEREQKGITSKDFIARLIELKNDIAKDPTHDSHQGLTEKIITAQGGVFFVAGFETAASTLSTLCHRFEQCNYSPPRPVLIMYFALYSFAKNPKVQRRAYEEVKEVAERHNGKINHETIAEMDYLEAVIMEDLRMHPPGNLHIRVCKEDCEVPSIISTRV